MANKDSDNLKKDNTPGRVPDDKALVPVNEKDDETDTAVATPDEKAELPNDEKFEDFCAWFAYPDAKRWEMLEIDEAERYDEDGKLKSCNQKHFSQVYDISQTSLSQWKKRPEFGNRVQNERIRWGENKTANVLQALYERCMKYGIAIDVELWLNYVEGWSRSQVIEIKEKFHEGDLRTIIDYLPENEKQQFIDTIGEALRKAELARREQEMEGLDRAGSDTAS